MPLISIIIPTVDGREDHLDRCVEAYRSRTEADHEIILYHNLPTCGAAWILGAEIAVGDYLHFTADDLEPFEGWDLAAIEAADRGMQPSPWISDPDGVTQFRGIWGGIGLSDWQAVPMSTIPFMSRKMLESALPLLDAHYYTDNWVSDQLLRGGYSTVFRPGYRFTHHWAQPGRGAGMTESERMTHDRLLYEKATRER